MSTTTALDEFAARLRAVIRASVQPGGTGAPEAEFDRLARELFALQFERNAAYRRFCEARGNKPETVRHWTGIPAVPAAAWKEAEMSCLPAGERGVVFHSSGTTEQRPSRHFHNSRSLALYEASLLAWFQAKVQAKNDQTPWLKPRLISLTPAAAQAPHSSLAYMFETARRELGSPDSVFLGQIGADGAWQVDLPAAMKALKESVVAGLPVIVLGTAFSFVHLADGVADGGLRLMLPPGSQAMETGGYKGRSRTLPREELHSLITQRLGIPPSHIIREYGMSELSSQAYDTPKAATTADAKAGRHFQFPPWARMQIFSPETGSEAAEGEPGLIRIFDLANVYSTMALQTEDLGTRYGDEFELLGRATLAEPRGCSLQAA